MRQWTPSIDLPAAAGPAALGPVVDALALPAFAGVLLATLRTVVPGTALSVYRTGADTAPQRYMGISHRQPDTTRACWRAYMSGPYRRDQTLLQPGTPAPGVPMVCHVSAREVPAEHRAKVYDAHGMAERVSIVHRESSGAVFAVNLYRHTDTPAFGDAQLDDFAGLAPLVLALTRKHLALLGVLDTGAPGKPVGDSTGDVHEMHELRAMREMQEVRESLLALHPQLTRRELDVCERVLRGMTDDGIAADLALGLPTVRTYRNRAFARLGIHFRSELFARMRPHRG